MAKRLLIDGAHEEEIRVAISDEERLEKFEFEILSKTQLKGNVYLAKIIRIEPSLQAAFIDYGRDRHGFLSFSEIHPNYYQIPVSDKEKLNEIIDVALSKMPEDASEEDKFQVVFDIKTKFYKKYTIQEVIKKRQVLLVQVMKDERGVKGAALSTYISLSGRYCVLMPNTHKPYGISKKISSTAERTKIKNMLSTFNIPPEMCIVVRTAGTNKTKQELKRDYEFLHKVWTDMLDVVLKSQAPCLISEEAGILKRSIRDMYSKEIDEVIVEGETSYKTVKSFMKKMLPSHAQKVKHYKSDGVPLFCKYGLNEQIAQMYSTRVSLPSGGYIVINNTEALVSIDVNSGKSIKQRSVEDTALKTNLEAATEVARQIKLRDLGGLIVVDFIDMADSKNIKTIEKTLKQIFKSDKAKTQVGDISQFGLLEISRQRLKSNLMETHRITCPYCNGAGTIWSIESMMVQALRKLEESCAFENVKEVKIVLSPQTAVYLLNNKRSFITSIEKSRNCKILVGIDYDMSLSDFSVEPVLCEQVLDDVDDHTVQENAQCNKSKKKSGKNKTTAKKKTRNNSRIRKKKNVADSSQPSSSEQIENDIALEVSSAPDAVVE